MSRLWREGMQGSVYNPNCYLTPPWTPESALAFMDSQGIATGILSLTTPGVSYWPADERRAAARAANDHTAGLAVDHPGRFGSFATLPLPDVGGALLELPHALEELKADGVTLQPLPRSRAKPAGVTARSASLRQRPPSPPSPSSRRTAGGALR